MSIDEFIESSNDENYPKSPDKIIPKHYRLIFTSMLNGSSDQSSFTGNVWITITPNVDHIQTIELDAKGLDIRTNDVAVFRSRILSDSDFQSLNDRDERSAAEDDASDESDMLWIDSNVTDKSVEKGSQELSRDEGNNGDGEANAEIAITEHNEVESADEATEAELENSLQPSSEAPEQSVNEYIEYNDTDTIWDGLFQNDTMLMEPNPDDQTNLQIDDIRFDADRHKLIITLDAELRRGHYYMVKVFFSGNLSNDNGFVYKSHEGTSESSDEFG